MRYEFADVEWTAISPLPPNEPRCAAWTTGVYATALVGFCIRAHRVAICRGAWSIATGSIAAIAGEAGNLGHDHVCADRR